MAFSGSPLIPGSLSNLLGSARGAHNPLIQGPVRPPGGPGRGRQGDTGKFESEDPDSPAFFNFILSDPGGVGKDFVAHVPSPFGGGNLLLFQRPQVPGAGLAAGRGSGQLAPALIGRLENFGHPGTFTEYWWPAPTSRGRTLITERPPPGGGKPGPSDTGPGVDLAPPSGSMGGAWLDQIPDAARQWYLYLRTLQDRRPLPPPPAVFDRPPPTVNPPPPGVFDRPPPPPMPPVPIPIPVPGRLNLAAPPAFDPRPPGPAGRDDYFH